MNYKPILKKALKQIDTPNLILYGYHKINKYEILKEYINLNNCIETTKYDIKYYSNNSIKIFDMNTIKKSKKDLFFNIILENIKCKNYYIDNNRILILYNFNHIDRTIQDKFRVIFEKYRKNTIFILITDYYSSILNPIKSRFLSIRIRDLTMREKINVSYPIIKNLTYDKRTKIYDKIYNNSDKILISNYSHNNHGLINDHKDIIETIYYSLKYMKVLELSKIRDYAYNLEKYNIKNFHSDFLKNIIKDLKIDIIQLKYIVYNFSEIESRYKKTFNRILSNEFLLIFIHNLFKNE
jgi:hypothetical protein